MHVNPRLRPEEQAGEVGDRGHGGAAHRAGAAQPREHHRDGGIGGDDHVGLVLGDAARQRAGAEQAQLPARQPADGGHVLEQPVDQRVAPGQEAQLHAVAVLDDLAQHTPHRGEAVDHRDLGRLGGAFDLLGQRAGSRGVPLADFGREDQDTAGPTVVGCLFCMSHVASAPSCRCTTRSKAYREKRSTRRPAGSGAQEKHNLNLRRQGRTSSRPRRPFDHCPPPPPSSSFPSQPPSRANSASAAGVEGNCPNPCSSCTSTQNAWRAVPWGPIRPESHGSRRLEPAFHW